jgi:O-antigen/teichoic acid export membrane protein
MRSVIGVVALVIAYFFSSKISQNPIAPLIYLLLSVASVVVILSEPLFSGLLALGRQKTVAAFDSARGILMLVGVSLVMIFKGGIVAIALLQAVLYLATFIILLLIIYRHYKLKINIATMWTALKTSFIYGISGQLFAIYSRIPIVLLAYFTNDRQVGYYTAAMRVVAIVQVVGGGIYSRAFVPSLFESIKISRERFEATSRFMFAYFTLFGALVGIGFFVLAEPIILILMGSQFYDSIFVLRVLSLAVFLIFVQFAPDAAMTAGNKNVKKVIFQVIGPIAGLLAGFLFVPKFQAIGAAYTQVVIMTVLLTLFLSYSLKQNFVNLQTLWQIRLPIAGVGICGIIGLLVFKHSYVLLTIVFCSSSAGVMWFWIKQNRTFLSIKSAV